MAEKIEVGIKVVQVGAATKDIDSVDAKIKELGSGFGLAQKLADKMTGGMASGMMAAYKSTKTFIAGLKLTKAAMISTGIGALVVAVGALTVALATQGGELSLWNKATKGWNAGFKTDIHNVTLLGEAFGKLFTSGPAEALAHFTDNFKVNLFEQQKAIASLETYHASLGKLVDLQRQLVLDTASSSLEQYKLNQRVNDGTLSTDDRISAMKDLSVEEYNLIDAREAALKLELETIELKVLAGEIADGDLDRKIAITASLTRMMEERYKVNDKYTKGVRTLRTQEANHAKQESDRAIDAANEVRKAEEAKKEAIIAANNARLDAVDKTLNEAENMLLSAQERELKALASHKYKVLKAAHDKIGELTKQNSKASEEEIVAALTNADNLEKALDAKRDKIIEKYRKAAQDKIDEDKALQDERNQVVTDYLMSEEELELAAFEHKAAALREANKLAKEDANALDEQLRLERLAITEKYDQAEIDTAEATAQAVRAARLGIVAAGFDALKVMAKTEEGQKKLAVAQILVNQGVALSSAIAGAQASAVGTGPLAVFTAPGFTATLIAMVLGSFASIKGIMNQAGADLPDVDVPSLGRGGGGGGGGSTQLALTPDLAGSFSGATAIPPVQAYIVQNDIADAATLQSELQAQATL